MARVAPGGRAPAVVRRFRDAVDAALPGAFAWFDDGALHCTIRALS